MEARCAAPSVAARAVAPTPPVDNGAAFRWRPKPRSDAGVLAVSLGSPRVGAGPSTDERRRRMHGGQAHPSTSCGDLGRLLDPLCHARCTARGDVASARRDPAGPGARRALRREEVLYRVTPAGRVMRCAVEVAALMRPVFHGATRAVLQRKGSRPWNRTSETSVMTRCGKPRRRGAMPSLILRS
jgi:hypothetical protein